MTMAAGVGAAPTAVWLRPAMPRDVKCSARPKGGRSCATSCCHTVGMVAHDVAPKRRSARAAGHAAAAVAAVADAAQQHGPRCASRPARDLGVLAHRRLGGSRAAAGVVPRPGLCHAVHRGKHHPGVQAARLHGRTDPGAHRGAHAGGERRRGAARAARARPLQPRPLRRSVAQSDEASARARVRVRALRRSCWP